ncbi:class I SAM-dependent methyltransferase [Taibaiella lutea]|uniref:Class I SAM-dependent methyltransferase n=1 Tax=Taibaiella lutea TaxID=2608001 RepID=A0A5M6CBR7_9BACT|nr:methyltransferase domain-containing protein [Taibaiella lutea]KAA5532433.1 class I SAM-dependent methyltransferase [Taibaiella lutea]
MNISTEAKHYTSSFYKGHEKGSFDSAMAILPLINNLLHPKSVIDIGCGIGLWLKVWKDELGVSDIKGVEGAYVNEKMLQIPREYVQIHDLKEPLNLGRRYDLASTLEVGEHLPASSADQFVQTLTSLSDVVLFSAALTGQIGTYHINEQPPEYWAAIFDKYGYEPIDYIRPLVWNKEEVMYWYRQNVLLFVKKDIIPTLPIELVKAHEATKADCLLRVHPVQYKRIYDRRNWIPFIHYRLYLVKKFFKERNA